MSYRDDTDALHERVREAEARAEDAEGKLTRWTSKHELFCAEGCPMWPDESKPKRKPWLRAWCSKNFGLLLSGFVALVCVSSLGAFFFYLHKDTQARRAKAARYAKQQAAEYRQANAQARATCAAYVKIKWPNLKCREVRFDRNVSFVCPTTKIGISVQCYCYWEDGMVLRERKTKKVCLLPPAEEGK